jgi:hypothetical protein
MRRRDRIARLAVSAEHHAHVSFSIELHHDVGSVVHGPQVPLRIEADRMRAIEKAVAKGTHEFSAGIEFHDGMFPAVDHEDVLPRVDRDPGSLPEIPGGGKLGPMRHQPQVHFRRIALRPEQACACHGENADP